MRRLLATGMHGWIEGELACRLAAFPGEYLFERISVRGDAWELADWSGYDSVLHLARIKGEGDPVAAEEALARRIAAKCAHDGVPHLLYMSTFHVYGVDALPDAIVDTWTVPAPVTVYGRAKLAAERAIAVELEGTGVRLSIVRPPLVYGPRQRGSNFSAIARFAARTPLFPETRNARSMIWSQNLCELVRLLCDRQQNGLYLPQDSEWVDTAELVRVLGRAQGNRVMTVPGTAPLMHLASRLHPKLGKLFGSARYTMDASGCGLNYRLAGTTEAVARCIGAGDSL